MLYFLLAFLLKGVECYDYSSKLNLILTGGIDHKVLAWNPYMEEKPMAFFLGHQMTVMAVAINDNTKHGYSFSKDGVSIELLSLGSFAETWGVGVGAEGLNE